MKVRIQKRKTHSFGRPITDPCPPCLYGLNGFCMECGAEMKVH